MAGVPEVGAHHALAALALLGDLGGAHDRGVGGQDAVVGAVLLHGSEQVLLGLHDLGGALDHEVGVGIGLGLIHLEVDALHDLLLLLLGGGAPGDHDVEVVVDGVPAVVPQGAGLQGDVQVGGGGEHHRQGVAHHAAADDNDVFNLFHV